MTPVPNRRWLQFSLRTLFVVVTACAVSIPIVREAWREWQRPHANTNSQKQMSLAIMNYQQWSHLTGPSPEPIPPECQ